MCVCLYTYVCIILPLLTYNNELITIYEHVIIG